VRHNTEQPITEELRTLDGYASERIKDVVVHGAAQFVLARQVLTQSELL
jgi:hypothetical protein